QFDETHYAGRVINQVFYIKLIKKEALFFVSLSFIFTVVILFLTFRSLWGVIFPLVVVGLSILGVFSFMKLTNKPMDLILNVIPTTMMVIGISYVIHLVSKYLEELRLKKENWMAIKNAYLCVGLPTFLAAITTAIGFLTLMSSNVKPVVDLGIYSAIGVGLCLLLSFTFLLAALNLLKRPRIVRKQQHELFWSRILHYMFLKLLKYKKTILLICLLLAGGGLWGILQIRTNNYILEDLKSNHQLKQDYKFFEEQFFGARPFEMSISLKDSSSVLDEEVLQTLDIVDDFLEDEYGVGFVNSPVSVIKSFNQAYHGGAKEYYQIPKGKKLKKIIRRLKQAGLNSPLYKFVSKNEMEARVAGRMADIGSDASSKRNIKLQRFMNSLNPKDINYKLTGSATLIEKNHQLVTKNLIKGLTLAFLLVSLVVGIIYRSIGIAFFCLIPNIFPLLLTAGIMGFFGVPLKLSTSIVFTIAFGIAVDDSLHFLGRLQMERKQGKSMLYALKRTYLSTGKAISVTSIILCGGFLTLTFSNFLGTFYIGLFTSLTLLFAVLADLILLPALLMVFYPKGKP
ncbi:efflux RND transporter permease subunit, partial [Xanthovirga aplysinae]|uniref:efflux RND transporter permease subunit n=1 Tax=Xanthovirga aplysinae TaxID=2529853 RepID=UPI0012BCB61A